LALEAKQGVSQLELLCKEIEKENESREHKKEQKRRKKRKGRKNRQAEWQSAEVDAFILPPSI